MKLFYFILLLFAFSSCELVDKAKAQIDHYKNKYEEFRDDIDAKKRGPKPFKEVFQTDESAVQPIISSSCANNQDVRHVYFSTVPDAKANIFTAIRNLYSAPYSGVLKPYWDIRYINPISTYVHNSDGSAYADHSKLTALDARTGARNMIAGTAVSQTNFAGSVVQSKCVNGSLAVGTTLNLNDAPEQYIEYAGPQAAFLYHIEKSSHIRPWQTNKTGNLMMQAYFDIPIYHNYGGNIGGSVAYNVFLYNPKIKKHLNYVIGIYAAGVAWTKEKAGIRYDPSTDIVHVATVVKDPKYVWWTTKSKKSKSIFELANEPNKTTKDDGKWDDFYRTNISYNNLHAVLDELKRNPPAAVAGQDFGLNPEDWEVTLVGVQYEVEEQGGKASLSGSFKGLEAFISTNPL